jgi:putative peptidoglycan lipid II flippase
MIDARRRGSASGRMFDSLLTVGVLSLLVKVTGAAKALVIARYFGLADSLDAFLIAFVMISFFAEGISGATQAALVPVLVEARHQQSRWTSQRLFASVTFLTLGQLLALSLVLAVAAQPVLAVLGSGFDAAKLEVARSSLLGLLPVLVFSGLSATWRGVLNAEGRFVRAAAVPALVPVSTILFLFAAGRTSGADTLVAATVAGAALELIVVGHGLRAAGYPLTPSWRRPDAALRQVLSEYRPMLASTLFLGGSLLLSYAIAAMLGPGSVSALSYGNKFLMVLIALGPTAMATAALPHFSGMAARRDSASLQAVVGAWRKWILLATIPVTVMLVALSEPIVRLLYERGEFSPGDTELVASVQACFLLQLPFAMLTALVFRAISSLRANRTLMAAAALHLCTVAGAGAALVPWMGVAGIALAVSLAVAVHCVYLTWSLARLIPARMPSGIAAPNDSHAFGLGEGPQNVFQRGAE